jgi:Trk-type K+ transport system membrane component
MLLGSIGMPALHELWLRVRHRSQDPISGVSRVTLVGSLLLLALGAALLFAFESTTHWQLRYPRVDTPGRLHVAADDAATTQTAAPGPRRLAQLDVASRAGVCLFESAAARTAGLRLVRVDESSITPASRWLLIVLMLIGGGIGGTAGGIRVLAAWACARSIFRPTSQVGSGGFLRVAAAMLLLVTATQFVLAYRDVGSFEASLFESVSASCNVGLSTGLTRQIYVESKIALIIAMVIGRAIPLGMIDLRTMSEGKAL